MRWTKQENKAIRALYPNYVALRKALPRRSYAAIKKRARLLQVVRKKHVWLAPEVARLRREFPRADRQVLLAALPGLSWGQILGKAAHLKLRRGRRHFKATGYPLIDTIRQRAFQMAVSMVELDELARSKGYFQKGNWSNGHYNRRALLRAIEELGGQVHVTWD